MVASPLEINLPLDPLGIVPKGFRVSTQWERLRRSLGMRRGPLGVDGEVDHFTGTKCGVVLGGCASCASAGGGGKAGSYGEDVERVCVLDVAWVLGEVYGCLRGAGYVRAERPLHLPAVHKNHQVGAFDHPHGFG